MRHSRGDAGIPGDAGAGPGCAQVNGRQPGSHRNGGARQEQPEVRSGPSGIQALGKDSGDKPGVPRQARNGNVPGEGSARPRRRAPLPPRAGRCEDEEGEPGRNSQSRDTDGATRNGNVLGEGTAQARRRAPLPPWAGNREDEEGEPGSNSRSRDTDGATRNGNVPGEGSARPQPPPPLPPRARSREDEEGEPGRNSQSRERDTDAATSPGGAGRNPEAPSGAECREWLWQRLRRLGEDMEGWEGKATAELAAGLARRIAGTPLCGYPEGPGTRGAHRERSSGASPDRGVPSGNYGSLLGMLRVSGNAESVEEDSGLDLHQEQSSGASPDRGVPSGNYGSLLGMLRVSGNAESVEEDLGLDPHREQSSGASPDCGNPSGNYGSLLGMLRVSGNAESVEEDSGLGWGSGSGSGSDREQGSGASPDHSVPSGNDGSFFGMLKVSGKTESTEEDSDSGSEREQAAVNVCVGALRRLEQRFPEAWARSWLDCGRVAEEEELDGDPVPFQQQRPLPPHKERKMAELLQEYLRERIVVEGTSKSNNSLILFPKPHGRGFRLSLDCRALNAATPRKPQETLDRHGILTSINPRSRFFSVLDLSNACLAIPLARSSWHRFAFTFQGRQFLFTRLVPTFHASGSIVHRRVAAMLAGLEPGAARGVFHYSDDILITGKRRRQVRYRTRCVLKLIQKAGFKVNREKAQLVQREVNYLGRTLGAAGRRVSQEKLRQICGDCDAPGPWNASRLRSILGKFNDLKEFIPDYCELVLPLQQLAAPGKWEREREQKWQREWERAREQLQQLKEALKAAPTLLFPNKCQPFVIRLSVHARTVGAVLLQEKAGTLLPVQHWSRKLSGQSWSPQDASCLAAVWAVQAFQKLTGPAPLVIRGPAGRYLLRGEPLLAGGSAGSQPAEQWRLLVAIEGPQPQESQTETIPPAPELGQLPPDIPKANVWFLAVEKGSSRKPTVAFAAASLEERWLLGVRRGPEEEEAALEALRELLEQHRSRFPLFLYSSFPGLATELALRRLRAFPGALRVRQVGTPGQAAPDERSWIQKVTARARAVAGNSVSGWKCWEPSAWERQEIVAQCHGRHHEGVEGTLCRVLGVQSWRDVREDVARWVRRCPDCRDGDAGRRPEPAPQREQGPWSRLQISLCAVPPAGPEGFRALLLVQDALSGWPDAFALRQPCQAEASRVLLREAFGRRGWRGRSGGAGRRSCR
ncbi:uncharacterized protein LOC121364658 [Pyrgilauda ruficollis]|uniref:uncharacterized protein LOC121364658 n=1 Tax=Pyrgilauda ruficollis TaxID=221976 RepID=UPI001B877BD8|nr:uncharacterized protein LOC121364658 [Pyrgilauda ruficollis]